MQDYRHDIRFGTFITPTAQPPQHAVELAQVTEQVGLDLVTFQDHPYQPAFLDTWTLLSYVAAATERVHLAANVTNLPLRPPAVLARAAASLDLLSGGRVALGLGGGAFWDAIVAMGGPRRTGGEALAALREAIEIIRAVWDTNTRGGVRVRGEHYQVVGAKRGPAPAHPIPIWVGAYKPRMLRLVGGYADGWLPSLAYLSGLEAIGEGNAIIDEAAVAAGRDPAEIRRLLNVQPQHADPQILAELALRYGVGTFIIGSDDPAEIERFGREVAPAVRELVEAGRRAGGIDAGSTSGTGPGGASDAGGAGLAGGASGGHSWEELGVKPTLDDGTRLSAVKPWDESDRPEAPPPPPGYRYSQRGRLVSQHLVDVHNALRSELRQVRDLVEQVRVGAMDVENARSALNQLALRQNAWTLGAYCESYCRVVTQHHTIEDEGIFPHLRRSEPGLAPVLDRLVSEHRVIHDAIEGVDKALIALAAEPGDVSQLSEAVDLLTDVLLSHLAYEERVLLEPLARFGMYAGQL
jgi:alkanesulfonate monooxygenase SsuD/methylene tetrahydromethanopterin reductase-like flavin-dependent oxidoreductase (luciferase family)/hemerythrin-like domain-containing protein